MNKEEIFEKIREDVFNNRLDNCIELKLIKIRHWFYLLWGFLTGRFSLCKMKLLQKIILRIRRDE